VDIQLTNKITDAIIKREDLLADERLKNVSIINFPNATNFKLTTEQADTIDSIINGTYKQVELKNIEEATPSASPKRYWIYAPGSNSSKWEEFYSQGIMGIGWDEMGDLKQCPGKDAMKTKMKELYGAEYSYINSALATWQFTNEIKAGDIVYAKKGMRKIIGRGIVESDYIFDTGRDEYKHIRKIKWTHNGEWEHPGQAVVKTLTDITPYTDYVQKLEALFIDDDSADVIEEKEIVYDPYTEDDFLSEVFMDAERYSTLVNLIKTKKNIILQGAPGVGKTFAAKRLAFSIMGQKDTSRVMMVQFHQSYSYEDFIMGFRPSKDGFELTPGPFYQFCKTAQDDDERDYFFIIDEINRGNVSKIFGELMMLIEKEKRGEKLRLLYSNELFSVPKNVFIIGMMNTADRSLAIIDYALRRRFAFFELEPAFDSEGFKAVIQKANNPKLNALVEQIKALNDFISKDESLGSGFRIGHSYLCANSEIADVWLEAVISYELLPLLGEYWFEEPSKIEQWAKRLSEALYD
jgi:5-methylcytosine-specific restriction protein B